MNEKKELNNTITKAVVIKGNSSTLEYNKKWCNYIKNSYFC